MPPWVDRFARLLDQGRRVGHLAIQIGEVLWQELGGIDMQVVQGLCNQQVVCEQKFASVESKRPFVHAELLELSALEEPWQLDCSVEQGISDQGLAQCMARVGDELGDLGIEAGLTIKYEGAFGDGTIVEYQSSSAGRWIPARVLSFDAESGLYHLDCRRNVTFAKVRAMRGLDSEGSPEPAFTKGDVVEYNSASHRCWIAAKVRAFDAVSGLYELNCKAHVAPDKIRKPQSYTADKGSHSSRCHSCKSSSNGIASSGPCGDEVKADQSTSPSAHMEDAAGHHTSQTEAKGQAAVEQSDSIHR